jgi:beta-glucosidase
MAALLFGDVNPSGKLPMTFPRSIADLPTRTPEQYPGVFADGSTTRPPGDRTSIRQVNYTEGLSIGYRWYEAQGIAPLFPFGHGLSYTRFGYGRLHVAKDAGGLRIRFRLTNSGPRSGTEVTQAYVALPRSAGEPAKRLLGWSRVHLAAGESRTVQITLGRSDLTDLHLLQYWIDRSDGWATASGRYTVSVGSSSQTVRSDHFTVWRH